MSGCHAESLDFGPLDAIVEEYAEQRGALIPILQRAQAHYGYLPCALLRRVSERTGSPLHQVYGVVTFYSQFYLEQRGKYVVRQCDGTACHVRGAGKIIDSVEQELGVRAGQSTPDHKYTYEVVYCLGSCGQAPVAVINEKIIGRLAPKEMVDVLKALP